MSELSISRDSAPKRDTLNSMRGLVRQHETKVSLMARLFDASIIVASLWFTSYLLEDGIWTEQMMLAAACAVGLFAFFSHSNELYRSWRGAPLGREIKQLWMSWFGVFLSLVTLSYLTESTKEYNDFTITSWTILVPTLMTIWRASLHIIVGYLRQQGLNTRYVAIAGACDIGNKLANTINNSPWMGLDVTGFYDDRSPAGARPLATQSHEILGNLDELVEKAKMGEIDSVYIALPMKAEERIRDLIHKLADTTASVHIVPDFFMYSLMKMNTSLSHVGDLPTVSVHETPFYGVDGLVKRIEDIIFATLIMCIIAIPMLVIAATIKITSPGPVIFKQRRYGLQGQEIEVWKFRSMSVCEDGDHVCQVKKDDDRVTRVGRILRRTSLDELPQFINVLQGSMSIVGPRPHAIAHNEEYRKLISGYMLRHKVKPGITGWAQINGWRGETDTLEKMQGRVEHDLAYIQNWSLWLDIKIIVMTLFKGFVNKNAY